MVILNANIVDVYGGELFKDSVAVKSGKIVRIGGVDDLISSSTIMVNVDDAYLCPGFIDAHIHVESSMLTLTEFAKAVLPHGTTSIVIDPHEIANILGIEGVRMFIEECVNVPLDIYFTIPSCVPSASNLETSGAELGADDIRELMGLGRVVGLGEVMDFPGVLGGRMYLIEKINTAHSFGKRVDGHAPSLRGELLQRYVSMGIHSDHECVDGEEALEKLRFGMWIMVREGSLSKDLIKILSFLRRFNIDTRRVMLVTDDLNPMDALKSHLNSLLRMVVELGYDPMDAIRMVTLNPATYYHLDDEIGGIAPGLKANMVVLRDLESFNVMLTISNGRIVAKDGKIVITIDKWSYPDKAYKTINVKRIPSTDDFKFKVNVDFGSALVHVIGVEDKSLYTKHIASKLAVQNGSIILNPKEDILQIAVIERHKSSGNISLGFVKGFGLNSGALASTIAHDSHNIVVVGVDWSDMAYAVKGIVDMGGGIIVVKNSRVLGVLPLPIAGLMSSEDAYSVSSKVELLYDNVRKLGCKLREPFMTLSFIALPVIPEIKLTDKGLVWHNPEIKKLEFISPIIGLSNFDLP